MTPVGERDSILAIDTATRHIVIATGSRDGAAGAASSWLAGYRHGETLLPSLERFLEAQDIPRSRLAGIVVGTGPGAFTGLRVGLATAKGLAVGLGIPLVGVSTAEALIAAIDEADHATGTTVLLLPAGPSDRLVARAGRPAIPLPAGSEPALGPGERLVAVDLEDRAPPDALARGEVARGGLGLALLRAGAARLAAGTDDAAAAVEALARLVPEYVTLPRGARASSGTVEWSRDPR